MSNQPGSPAPKPGARPIPRGPSVEEWRAMTPEAREQFLVAVNEALSDLQIAMSEGRPHKKAKVRAIDLLGMHFKAKGRDIYLAEEMSVVYPGEVAFSPDVLAIVDVPQPEDDERLSWVVADEGRGLDFVLEVLHRGDRKKDLVDNVERYARLGIPEYFVYDRGRQVIVGHRLSAPEARRYQRIVPQAGRYHSNVLGLDLAVERGTLRFFEGMAELFGTADLIARLEGMVSDLEARAVQAESEVEQARTRVDAVVAAGIRDALLALLAARNLACSDELRAEIERCEDPATLQRWLTRAATAASAREAISAGP
jgi:Uma2 family endonuclease